MTGSHDNAAQIADWNGTMGERWAALQQEIDGIVVPFGNAALAAAAARPGERAIDIGCGCGDTSIALARAVGAAGAVLGVDISLPMLAVARERGAGLPQLAFSDADASAAELPPNNDLLFSRFGVMFFSQPTPAFVHLRRSLRAGGRCVFVCWRTPRDNAWAMTPLAAARAAMDVTPARADPFAPGPFAFADEARLRTILSEAGFSGVELQRFDAAVTLGATPRAAAENALRVGPTSRFVTEVGEEHRATIRDAVEAALTPLAAADGTVKLNGSTWIVSARSPAGA